MKFDKLFTIICFIGLSSPLWFGLAVMIALNAYAPGFDHAPVQSDTTEFYRTLPDRIKSKSDSLNALKNNFD
jgi:hypothetical protein